MKIDYTKSLQVGSSGNLVGAKFLRPEGAKQVSLGQSGQTKRLSAAPGNLGGDH